ATPRRGTRTAAAVTIHAQPSRARFPAVTDRVRESAAARRGPRDDEAGAAVGAAALGVQRDARDLALCQLDAERAEAFAAGLRRDDLRSASVARAEVGRQEEVGAIAGGLPLNAVAERPASFRPVSADLEKHGAVGRSRERGLVFANAHRPRG